MDFKPKNEKELLAWDLANNLNDFASLPLYISYANKYSDGLLRKALGDALEVPANKIRKTRIRFIRGWTGAVEKCSR